jgi:heme/copper-type cytochrome/quinol oxidase subunit 2
VLRSITFVLLVQVHSKQSGRLEHNRRFVEPRGWDVRDSEQNICFIFFLLVVVVVIVVAVAVREAAVVVVEKR